VLDALLVESSILLDTGHSVQRAAIIPAISRRARRPSDLAYTKIGTQIIGEFASSAERRSGIV